MITKEALKTLTAKNQEEIRKLGEIGIGVFYVHTQHGKVTTCYLYDNDDGEVKATGKAYRNDTDPMNHRYGRFLSFIRAKSALTQTCSGYGGGKLVFEYLPSIPKLDFLAKKKAISA